MSMTKTKFGELADGTAVDLFTLKNVNGVEVAITNYGGIIVSWMAPDKHGKLADIVVGCDTLAGFLAGHPYFGALVGRYGNRIAGGKFVLNGVEYALAKNNGGNHLHGGLKGFDKVVWHAEEKDGALVLSYLSKDGEEGYPGNLQVTVVYALSDQNALSISYTAHTDKATPINLTNHTYFNLSGAPTILDHVVQLNADAFTATNQDLIPTGEVAPVRGTALDFTQPHAIGERINADETPIKFAGGYDHNFVLNGRAGDVRLAARVTEPTTGRVLECFTDQPAIQLYTGNFLVGTVKGKGGKPVPHRGALCLETQHFPNSPNQPNFPSTILQPGQTYATVTVYRVNG
jgi:aldose 1-epimerase